MKCGNMWVGIHQYSVIQTQAKFLNLPERICWQAFVADRRTVTIANWKRHWMLKCCFGYGNDSVRCCSGCLWIHGITQLLWGVEKLEDMPWSWEVKVFCSVMLRRSRVLWLFMLYLFCIWPYLLTLAFNGQQQCCVLASQDQLLCFSFWLD